jgi:DNA polymerase III subunit epsilon
MDFVAVDVETANPDYSSICQIGIAGFADGVVHTSWKSYVDPQDYFYPMNIAVHGISETEVSGAPTFSEIYSELVDRLAGQIVVHHTAFDKVSINRAVAKHGLRELSSQWLDSARIARRAWEKYSRRGYGLANLTSELGIQFAHHDALEDAIAAGKIACMAVEKSGICVQEWLTRVSEPITKCHSHATE